MPPQIVDSNATITRGLRESGHVKHLLAVTCGDVIAQAAALFADTLKNGRKVLFFGNGGSAADAQHLAAELVGRYLRDRRSLPGIALTTDTSVLTAIGNDYGYDEVFARQIRALGQPGDLAVGLSTGGTSRNVNLAISAARELGLRTIGLSGKDGGELASLAELTVVVPSQVTARIQEAHITIGHIWCELADSSLFFGDDDAADSGEMAGTPKVLDRKTMGDLRRIWRTQAKKVVWTNGCFDVLHVGHVRSLQAAKQLGDILVVGVNDDATVTALKGPGRPVFPAAERAEMLSSLECVDYVLVFDEPTPVAILAELQPDVHCKGADYAAKDSMPEWDVVERYGGVVKILPLSPGRSTSRTLEQLGSSADR